MDKLSVVYSPTCEGTTLSQSTTLSTTALSCTVLLGTIGSLEMSLKFRIWLQITNFIWNDLLPWMKSTLSYNFNQLKESWNQKLIRSQSTLIKLNFHSINQSYIFETDYFRFDFTGMTTRILQVGPHLGHLSFLTQPGVCKYVFFPFAMRLRIPQSGNILPFPKQAASMRRHFRCNSLGQNWDKIW